MTLMPEVPRLWLHAYVRVCSTELQQQPCTKFLNSSKCGLLQQVMALITVLIPFNKITQTGSWQPKLWKNKITSIWILTGKRPCLRVLTVLSCRLSTFTLYRRAFVQAQKESMAYRVDCLQSPVSLKIRPVLISSGAIANHDVIIYFFFSGLRPRFSRQAA